MLKTILAIVFIIFAVSAAKAQFDGDTCKQNSSRIQIEINYQNTINNNILENNIENKIILKSKETKINNPLLNEELKKENYSPKAIYFRVVAKELESVYNEMLT